METLEEIVLNSPTHGQVNLLQIVDIIKKYIQQDPEAHYEVTIGTDSQNFHQTKIVEVIAVHKVGHGGIFFYKIIYKPLIRELRRKLTVETQLSIDLAKAFVDALDKQYYESEDGWDYTSSNISYQLHCDIGFNGATNKLIPEITAWVKSAVPDFTPCIKPESFAASGIANKYSK